MADEESEIVDIRSTEPDVVDILSTDHDEAAELIGEIQTTTDSQRRRDLADIVIAELVRHSVAEEMFVYPAMRRHLANGEEAVNHDIEEHKELERIMKQLEGCDVNDPAFDDLVRDLGHELRHHVHGEETEQFPELRSRVPRAELVSMGKQVEAAKKVAPTRPHPGAPNNALFHMVVGPGVGMVDRLRDKLSGRVTSQ